MRKLGVIVLVLVCIILVKSAMVDANKAKAQAGAKKQAGLTIPDPGRELSGTVGKKPVGQSEKIPILMYHQVGIPTGHWKELYVDPGVFADQLDWLQKNRFTTVTLQQVYNHWINKAPLADKPIVLTFDDGYRSMYDKVLPMLKERKMKATFFLYPKIFNTSGGLTDKMIAEMAGAGMEIGSHTYNHLDLSKIPASRLKHELADSKTLLQGITKQPVNFLCYPAGRFNNEVIRQAKAYGYKAAVTTKYGKTTADQNLFEWTRIRINGSDGVKGFVRKMSK